MASNSGAQVMVKVGFDDSGREAFLAGNERAFKRSSDRIAASERQARRGSAFAGGQNAAYRVGMVSQQAQDVAVSLQMGMSASRVIAQQGSQIASIFGPKGMVIGGAIAIGAAIAEWALNTKEADEAAERYKKTQEEIGEIAKRNAKQSIENNAAIVALQSGPLAGRKRLEELEFEQKQKEIQDKRNEVLANASEQRKSKAGWHWRRSEDFDTSTSDAKRALIKLDEEEYIASEKINIARDNASRKRNTEADMAVIKGQQEIDILEEVSDEGKKSLQDYYDFKNRLSEIDMSDQSDINKVLLSQIAENLYAAKTAAEKKKPIKEEFGSPKALAEAISNEQKLQKQGETHAEKLLDISKKIGQLNSEAQSIGITDIRRDEIRLELSKLQLEQSAELKGASEDIVKKANEEYSLAESMSAITNRDAATKLEVLKAEKDLLQKKIAWTPNELQLLNARKQQLDEDIRKQQVDGLIAAGGAGMGVVAQQRAQEKAQERARKRAEGNLGLGQIKRGMSGEIIGGVNLDPNSGKVGERVGPEEIARRQKLLGLIGKKDGLPIEATALFTPKQIKDLSDSIALAILATTTK